MPFVKQGYLFSRPRVFSRHHISAFIESSLVYAQSSSHSPNATLKTSPQKASPTTMAFQKKVSSQTAAASATSKSKKIINGGTCSVGHHPQNPNIALQPFEEEHSSPMTTPEEAANKHDLLKDNSFKS